MRDAARANYRCRIGSVKRQRGVLPKSGGTRNVVSDSTGTYRIVDLRPGTYTVTFTLTGFATVKREDIQLTGTFTATVNAELKVGGVAETITVSGQSPIVDVQNAVEQRV